MDYLRGTDNSLAVRHCYFVYHGRIDPHSTRHSGHHGAGPSHPGTENPLVRRISASNPFDKTGRTVMRPVS